MMVTGTFPKTGEGTPQFPIIPDFTSLGYDPVIWETVSETATTMTVNYQTQ